MQILFYEKCVQVNLSRTNIYFSIFYLEIRRDTYTTPLARMKGNLGTP
jgi:hypothetical protein